MSAQKNDFEDEIGDYDEVAIQNHTWLSESRTAHI